MGSEKLYGQSRVEAEVWEHFPLLFRFPEGQPSVRGSLMLANQAKQKQWCRGGYAVLCVPILDTGLVSWWVLTMRSCWSEQGFSWVTGILMSPSSPRLLGFYLFLEETCAGAPAFMKIICIFCLLVQDLIYGLASWECVSKCHLRRAFGESHIVSD